MSDRTNNTAQTTSNVIATSYAAATPIYDLAKAAVTTQEAPKTKKNKLSATDRKADKTNAKYASIGDMMQEAGIEIGTYTAYKDSLQSSVVEHVTTLLKSAMKQGLDVNMLKAPTKDTPREAYTCLVDAMNAARVSAGMKELDVRVRDNYMSKIRAFVKDRGANPLDLFGNLATKAKKVAAKSTSSAPVATQGDTGGKDVGASPAGKTVSFTTKEAFKGLPALQAFLTEWLAVNPVNSVEGTLRDMVVDVEIELSSVLTK